MKKISIIIPTKNEPYVGTLVKRIKKSLKDENYEIIVVEKGKKLPRVSGARVFHQISDGLGNAFIEGLKKSSGNLIVLMDGDGQHRPEDLPKMVLALKDSDIVVGSRFVQGGKSSLNKRRKFISWVAKSMAAVVLGVKVRDTMSGFFAARRKVFEKIKLNPLGYKILLEIIYKSKNKGLKIKEVPIIFEQRKTGKTKYGFKETMRFFRLILELKLGMR